MTKRIVSGIFILTALGALGVILAGALTSGEQLIVRFLTAVIVAALGLYVISDLRLQADDDALTARTGGQNRVGKVDAPPNSTAAFMATVTKKVDPRRNELALSKAGPLANGESLVPEPANRQQRADAGHKVDAAETTIVSDEVLDAVTAGQNTTASANNPTANGAPVSHGKKAKIPTAPAIVPKKRVAQEIPPPSPGKFETSIPAGAETVVTSNSDFLSSPGHAMAGVGAMASSASGTGEVPGSDGEGSSTPDASEPAHEDFIGSQSIDISDLFADEGAKANFANGYSPKGNGSNGHDTNGGGSNGGTSNGSTSNGGANGSNGSNGGSNGGGSNNGYFANDHISGRLSETTGIDAGSIENDSPFNPVERVYDLEGLDHSAVTGETGDRAATEFEYSDDLESGDYVWPAVPANGAPEPHPFEKASAAYEAAKRKLEEVEPTAADRHAFSNGKELEPAADDAPLAPIIDLRGVVEPGASDVDTAINAGEVEVIATLIEQGMLSTSGPISDREVRTMVYVAFTSNELRKLLMAGGSPDGPNYGLDLGPVELFDERIHAPAPKRLYSGTEASAPSAQIG